MTVTEIVAEEESSERKPNVITLYGDSSGWFKAFELSAYLLRFCNNGLDESKRLKPTKKQFKGIDHDVVFVGVRIESLKKYAPNIDFSLNGNTISLTVDLSYYNLEDGQTFKDALENWKSTIELTKHNKENKTDAPPPITANTVGFMSMSLNIMKKIMSYNIRIHSAEDNANFIDELKEMTNGLLV